MRDETLVALLSALPDLPHVSRMRIERDVEGWWLVVHRAGMLDVVGAAERAAEPEGWESAEREEVTLAGDLPAGVEVSIRRARPRVRHRLPLDGADPQDDVSAMLGTLAASGLVGGLDVARMESVDLDAITRRPWPVWHITTHAGSDAERAAWVRGLSHV